MPRQKEKCFLSLQNFAIIKKGLLVFLGALTVHAQVNQVPGEPQAPVANTPFDYSSRVGILYNQMKPTGSVKDLIDKGHDFVLWFQPEGLTEFNKYLYETDIPIIKRMGFIAGVYYNEFTGPLLNRVYKSAGIAPGIILEQPLDGLGKHEFIAQFDFRIGWVGASRDKASNEVGYEKSRNGFAIQPAVMAGYQYVWDRYKAGLVVESLLSSDKTPVVAYGAGVRFTMLFGKKEKAKEEAPSEVPTKIPAISPEATGAPVANTSKETDLAAGSIANVLPDGVQVNIPVSRVTFDFGSDLYNTEGKTFVQGLVAIIKKNQADWDKFEITGHTDSQGQVPYNERLSRRRASRIASDLKRAGVAAKKIVYLGLGSSQPLDPAENEAAYKQNRRVVLRIYGSGDAASLAKEINDLDRSLSSDKSE